MNLYKTGFDECGWHADDESIFGEEPTIALISLGCSRRFQLRPIPETSFSRHCKTFFDLTLTWCLNHSHLLVMRYYQYMLLFYHKLFYILIKCTTFAIVKF